jgi:hypothetical protein
MKRNRRLLYALLIMFNVPLGLETWWCPQYFSELLRVYGGDVLSATCIFFGLRVWQPLKPLWLIVILNYVVCFSIELSQLCQAKWLQNIRNTPPFGILLGYGFLWSDCVCYAVGTAIAFLIAYFIEQLLLQTKPVNAYVS